MIKVSIKYKEIRKTEIISFVKCIFDINTVYFHIFKLTILNRYFVSILTERASRFYVSGVPDKFCYRKISLPNLTVQQGCDSRNPDCRVVSSFFCNSNEDDSQISISLLIDSLSNLKTTLSVIYCGYTLYDWIDIAIQTRNIHENTKLDFEDKYLSEFAHTR